MGMPYYLEPLLAACSVCRNKARMMCGFAVLLFAASVSASTITISASGTFLTGTAASSFSGPDETWSFSFVVDTNPAVSNVNLGNYFDADFSDFTYYLDGSPVAITPVDIRFFSTLQYGGFEICFATPCEFFNSPTDGFDIIGLQMYSGSESAPTMLADSFTSTFLDVYVNSEEYNQPAHQSVLVVATPEPSSILTLGSGLLLALAGRRLRRRSP